MSDLDTFTTPVRMCISAGLTRGSINDGFTMCMTAMLCAEWRIAHQGWGSRLPRRDGNSGMVSWQEGVSCFA